MKFINDTHTLWQHENRSGTTQDPFFWDWLAADKSIDDFAEDIDIAEVVTAHALTLKIGAVNAIRTDGGPDYPISADALAEIRRVYSEDLASVSAKGILGQTPTSEDLDEVTLIQAGFGYFKAVDAAAKTIIGAGDPANPIEDDGRWPAVQS